LTLRTVENECVGCPPDLGCLGSSCPYRNVEHIVCDLCGEPAEYVVDDEELCEDCAKERILEVFNNYDIFEQADMLDVSLRSIE
jgi:hypothetical protein